MDYQEDQLVEVNVVFIYSTDDAIKVEDADGRQVWLPISALKGGPEPCDWDEGLECTFSIPESLARNKGLI
jgi:hypothetical protein